MRTAHKDKLCSHLCTTHVSEQKEGTNTSLFVPDGVPDGVPLDQADDQAVLVASQ